MIVDAMWRRTGELGPVVHSIRNQSMQVVTNSFASQNARMKNTKHMHFSIMLYASGDFKLHIFASSRISSSSSAYRTEQSEIPEVNTTH